MNKIKYTFIDYGPMKEEIIERDRKRKCLSIQFNKYGETEFFCNNYVEPYNIFPLIPLKKPLKIWISYAMICNECLENLKNKYDINFKNEIPKWYLQRGTIEYNKIDYKNLPLIKDLELWFKNYKQYKNNYFFDPEIRWFRDINFLYGIPIYWLKEFKLISCITKGSLHQGSFNGPDYIFKDIKANKLIGFEIVSYKWNIFDSFRDISNIKKFAKKQIFNTFSFDNRIGEFKKIIKNKSKKKYSPTDELYLGIVVNNTLVDYEYCVLEIILNNWLKRQNIKLNGVYIL